MPYIHDAVDTARAIVTRLGFRKRPAYKPYPKEAENVWNAVVTYLKRRNLSPTIARENRWYPSFEAGDRALRLVIPATNSAGFPFWQARALEDDEPRYQSPHGVSREDSIVVVWPTSRRTPKPGFIVVVEGPMDALAAAGSGAVGVSLMGATPPVEVYDHIARIFPTSFCLVVPDADQRAAGSRHVLELRARGAVAFLRLIEGENKDLAECSLEERHRLLFKLNNQ